MLRRAVFCRISVCISRANPISSLDAQPIEKINGLLFRQYLRGANLRFVKGTAKKGAVVPLTHRVNEQAKWITEGLAEVYSQGRK